MRTTAALALLLLGCGGAAVPAPINVANHVQVVVTGAPNDALPFDPKNARLLQATSQLYGLVGHAVTFQFDAALVPEWRSSFDDVLTYDVETTIADLVRLRERSPAAFARGAAAMERVVFAYDPVARDQSATLDAGARVFKVSGSGGPWRLDRGAVEHALRTEYESYITARLANLEPEAVPAAERADYFQVLTDSHARRTNEEITVKLVRLAKLPGLDAELAATVRKRLFGELSSFSHAYFEGAPRTPEWQRAESAYVGWLVSQLTSATDDEKMEITSAVFVRRNGHSVAAFPGFDRFAFGMSILDDWAKAGHPNDASGPHGRLYGAIACPTTRPSESGRSFGGRCEHTFYEYVFDDDANVKRFADALLARNDPALVETAALGAYYANTARDRLDLALGFARDLEANEALWTVELATSADETFEATGEGGAARVVDEARRVWRAYPSSPSRHGTLLYAMVQTDRYEHGSVDWEHFATLFGAPVSEADFVAYLGHGVRAMSLARVMWPALGKFARAPALTAKLDAYLDNPRNRAYDSADPFGAVRGISQRLCDEHATADLTELAALFKRRLASHPGELFGDKLDDPASCRAPLMVGGRASKHYVSISSTPSPSTRGHSTITPILPGSH